MVRTDFTPMQIRMMVGMLSVKNDDYLNLAVLARKIGVSPSNPQFYRVTRYLAESGILHHVRTIGSSRIIQISHTKLRDLLDEQDYVNYLVDHYLAPYHVFTW